MTIKSVVRAKFGDNIAAEAMASSKYVKSFRPEDLAAIAMLDLDPDFPARMKPGGILVAGKNFGCNSSREWGPLALKAAGTELVVADFFARIFYRNAVSIGLPIMECEGASLHLNLGDELVVDLVAGTIANTTSGMTIPGTRLPPFLLERIAQGGLIPYLKKELAQTGGRV